MHSEQPERVSGEAGRLTLYLSEGSIDKFVYLLQSGIRVKSTTGELLGLFLEKLPGFSVDYIIDEVQTIFLDGTAIDDLQTPLTGESPVVALSAAMPGLSGAIFRRNSIHAALRTVTANTNTPENSAPQPIDVTLKLFNAIAREKGPQLLREGITIRSASVLDYLNTRKWLLNHIHRTRSTQNENGTAASFPGLLEDSEWLHLTFVEEK